MINVVSGQIGNSRNEIPTCYNVNKSKTLSSISGSSMYVKKTVIIEYDSMIKHI